jgi:hypothetical protein
MTVIISRSIVKLSLRQMKCYSVLVKFKKKKTRRTNAWVRQCVTWRAHIVMPSVRRYDTRNSEPNNTGKWPLLRSLESRRTAMKRLDGAVETWATLWFWDRELIASSANIRIVVQRSVVAFGLQTEGMLQCFGLLHCCTAQSGRSAGQDWRFEGNAVSVFRVSDLRWENYIYVE